MGRTYLKILNRILKLEGYLIINPYDKKFIDTFKATPNPSKEMRDKYELIISKYYSLEEVVMAAHKLLENPDEHAKTGDRN